MDYYLKLMYLLEKYELKHKKIDIDFEFEFELELADHELILFQIYK